MKIAFFDIDGTLTQLATERSLIKFLFSNRILSPQRFISSVLRFLFTHCAITKSQWKAFKTYLCGLKVSEIESAASECFEKTIRFDFRDNVVAELNRKRAEGYTIVLLSGSIDPVANLIARYLNADALICSKLERKSDRFTGNLVNLHPYGIHKKKLAEKFCQDYGTELKNALAFANDYSDRFLMASAGEAVAVYPDPQLKKMALQRNWKIIDKKE